MTNQSIMSANFEFQMTHVTPVLMNKLNMIIFKIVDLVIS